jgi:hypothetical protein
MLVTAATISTIIKKYNINKMLEFISGIFILPNSYLTKQAL